MPPGHCVWLALLLAIAQAATAAAPFAATQAPGPISPTNATLNGMATPNGLPTLAWFDWGTNAAYGQSTSPVEVGASNSVCRLSAAIAELAPSGVYHYRLVVSNATGIVLGMERRFTTGLRVRAWGRNDYGQTNVPGGLTNAVAIAAGWSQAMAAGSDGRITGWGTGYLAPSGLSNVIALAVGNSGSLALQADGRAFRLNGYSPPVTAGTNVVAVAAGPSHYLLLQSNGKVITGGGPTVPSGLSNVVAVAASANVSHALKADGTILSWGSVIFPPPASLSNFVDIAGGAYHCLAVKSDGTVVAWGNNTYGQTNVPAGLSNVVGISAGSFFSLALRQDGSLVAWGKDSTGLAQPPAGLTNAATMSCGQEFDIALANRAPQANATEVAVPLNRDSVITLSGTDPDGDPLRYRIIELPVVGSLFQYTTNGKGAPVIAVPTEVDDGGGRLLLTPAVTGSTNPLTTLTFTVNDGNAESPPANLTIRTLSQPLAFTQPVAPALTTSATFHGMVTPSTWHTVAWFEYGPTPAYGQSTLPVAMGDGAGVTHASTEVTGLAPNAVYHCRLVASNLMGVTYGFDALFTTGRKVAAWGNNWWGQTDLPAGLSNVTAIAGGDYDGLALTASGTLVGWGSLAYGAGAVPPSLTNVASISCGGSHDLALLRGGTVVGWGENTWGQTTVPASLSNVVAVAGGENHSLALKADGTVVAWGDNRYGQTNVPAGLSNVVAISTRGSFSLALKHNGSVIAWGANEHGQTNVPSGMSNLVAVAASFWHSLALKADGTLVQWGFAMGPALGVSNVVAIAGGGEHSLALQADGTVATWGGSWQFGEGIVPNGLEHTVDIAGANWLSLALAPNVPPQTSSQAVTGTTNQPVTIALVASDPNSDPITLRIVSLPLQGGLFQYTTNGPSARFTAPDTAVADPQHRVVFVPDPEASGSPYAEFSYLANDGETDSRPAIVTVHILPPPRLEAVGFDPAGSRAFALQFSGVPGAVYRVQASTNLVNWQALGPATEQPPGSFRFSDLQSTNRPRRFYRVSSP